MTFEEIIQRRLFCQNLSIDNFTKPNEIVRWFGAVQSQDFSGSTWALSQRLKFSSNKELEESFNAGEILRTHVMRPTWHFVTPEDILWMVELTGARVKRSMNTYNKALGLDDQIFEKSEKIIEKALKNNNYLTRGELGILLQKNGINWHGNGLAHIVSTAELNKIICSGPKKGKLQTYALLSERAPKAIRLSKEDALKELAKRYFQSHGPAQIIDYVWWSGLLTSDAKKGIELNTQIKSEIVDGKTYYFFDTKFEKSIKKVYLLPNYDEYTVAFRDREVLTKNVDKTKLDFRQNSLFNHVVIIDGKIEGVWRRTIKSMSVIIETRLFRVLVESEKEELDKSLHEYAKFLNLELKTI